MRKPLIIANWKMHGSRQFIEQWLQSFAIESMRNDADIVICTPHPYLSLTKDLCQLTRISTGAQDVNEHDNGAFTGEISASMLLDCGCDYVLIGHSERRALFCDTDTRVAAKMRTAMHCGIIPVLCIGESLEQRRAEKTKEVLRRQIASALQEAENIAESLVLAYEPIWAIGSGQSATSSSLEEISGFIRTDVLPDIVGLDIADKVRILYGGSINQDNVEELFALSGIDGGLVGGASLDGKTFRFLCEVAGNRREDI